MTYNYNFNQINKFLSMNQIMENDAEKRSILISGITQELNIESILNAFSDFNVTGGGVIQSYEFYSSSRMRITYFYQKDAERVLSRGSTYKIGKIFLTVSRFSYDYESSFSSNSSLVTAIVNSSRTNTPLEIIKPIDQKRILLTNVPNSIEKEYLDLYLEYLSDEVEIERIDVGQEMANSIVVTYSKFIDFENLKKKHKSKPKILKNTTAVLPVYLPNSVILEFEGDKSKKQLDKNLNSEMLELYFSNKKRSGGHNAKNVRIDSKKNFAIVSFENFETAKQVCTRKHSINGLDLIARLYYDNIGPDPFSIESKIHTSKLNEKNKTDNKDESTKLQHQTKNAHTNNLPDSQRSTYTIESDSTNDAIKNSIDKPKVNLPSLDDPILSFEEYAILNNISLKPDIAYGPEKEATQSLSEDFKTKFSTETRPDAFILGGKNSHQVKITVPPVPKLVGNNVTFDPQSVTRAELEAKLNESDKNLQPEIKGELKIKFNEKRRVERKNDDEQIIGGMHGMRADTPKVENFDIRRFYLDRLAENEKKESFKLADNAKIRIKNDEEMTGFILGGSNGHQVKVDSNKASPNGEEKKEPNEKLFDFIFNQESEQMDDSIFEKKVNAIKKIIEDPQNKKRSQLESLLYGHDQANSENESDYIEEATVCPTPTNSPKTPVFKTDSLKNSIEVNKSRLAAIPDPRLNQTLPSKVRALKIPPLPKIVQKESLNISLQETTVSKENESKPIKVILKPRPFSSVEKSFNEKGSNSLKLKNNHILSQYGNSTTADSINKLNPKFIQFLKSNSFLEDVKNMHPKININLNENQKRLYFFGAQNQVLEAKALISKDLEAIKSTVVKLNSKLLANFLKKSNTKERLEDHFKKFSKNKEKYSFFSFDVLAKKEKESEEYLLNIYSNCPSFIPDVHDFINKNVMVGLKVEINSTHLSNSIKNEDQKWMAFYSDKYKNSIDYKLEFHKIRNKNSDKVEQRCFLKLTGFKDNIQRFQNELATAYKLKKVA